jgi:hypothetical protein
MLRWRKSWIDENLEGSIRKDLKPEERSVWSDLLDLCGKSRRWGYVERSEGMPYSVNELADKFVTPIKIIKSSINKCLIEGRLKWEYPTEDPLVGSGALVISHWERYQAQKAKEEPLLKEPIPLLSPEDQLAKDQFLAANYGFKHPEAALRGAEIRLSERNRNGNMKDCICPVCSHEFQLDIEGIPEVSKSDDKGRMLVTCYKCLVNKK